MKKLLLFLVLMIESNFKSADKRDNTVTYLKVPNSL
jgi:hypothetical protein